MVQISTVFNVCLQRDRFCLKFVVNVIIFVTGCTLQLKNSLRTLSLGFLSVHTVDSALQKHTLVLFGVWYIPLCSTIEKCSLCDVVSKI